MTRKLYGETLPPAAAARATAVERLAAKAGTMEALARWCGVDPSTVSHWNQPGPGAPGGKPHGRDGAIPDRYHRRILTAARAAGVTLDPAELVNV